MFYKILKIISNWFFPRASAANFKDIWIHCWERQNEGGGGYAPGDIIDVLDARDDYPDAQLKDFLCVRVPDSWFSDYTAVKTVQFEEKDGEFVKLRYRRYFLDISKFKASDRNRLVKKTTTPKDVIFYSDYGITKDWIVDKEVADKRFTITDTSRRSKDLS